MTKSGNVARWPARHSKWVRQGPRALIIVCMISSLIFGMFALMDRVAFSDELSDQWYVKNNMEPWQNDLIGVWPDVSKMISIVYPVAKSGNVRARLTFAMYVSLTKEFPPDSIVAGEGLLALRRQAVLWTKEIIDGNDKEASRHAREVMKLLTRKK